MEQKNRKSEAQKKFEEAENAGRFAGNDADAQAARNQALENIRQDTASTRQERNPDGENRDHTDADAGRDPAQVHDLKEEAQNVNDDTGRSLSDEEAEKARNKANEGIKQNRD